jgi:hypothetical protein
MDINILKLCIEIPDQFIHLPFHYHESEHNRVDFLNHRSFDSEIPHRLRDLHSLGFN